MFYPKNQQNDFGNNYPVVHGSGGYIQQLLIQKYGIKNPVLFPFHECYNELNYDEFNKIVMPPQDSPNYSTAGLQVIMLFYGKVTISGTFQRNDSIKLLRHTNVLDLSSVKREELHYQHSSSNDFQMTSTNELLFNEIQFSSARNSRHIALDGFLIKLN